MPVVLVVALSAATTWLLLVLALSIKARTWKRNISIDLVVPGWGGSTRHKVTTIVLLLAILATIGSLVYVLATPKAGEKTTEFYLLGSGGRASNYPAQLAVGEEGKVKIGIINGEHETTTYYVDLTIDGVSQSKIGPITLNHGSRWEEIVGFTPAKAGNKQTVAFGLYRQGDAKVYRTVYFRVDVR